MELFKKHVDTVIILAAFSSAILWMNGRFNQVDKQFAEAHQDLAIMKTVLIMKNIMPVEMAASTEKK